MSSIASRQYNHSRSRLPSVVPRAMLLAMLFAMLFVAAPRTIRAQTADSQPRQTATGGASRAKAAGSDSSFLQRLIAALASGLTTRDSTSQPSQQPLVMPNLVGRDTLTALKMLAMSLRGRKVRVSYVIAPPVPTLRAVDRIAGQSPAEGTTVGRVLNVRLTLDGLPRPTALVSVPPLIGLLADSAVRVLRARELVEDLLEKGVTAPESIGRVTGQNPPPRTQLAVGGTVAIAIGRDARVFAPNVASPTTPIAVAPAVPVTTATQPTVIMPGLLGRDTSTAIRILRGAGLSRYRFRVPVNRNAVDTVRAQVPDSGRRIAVTNAVVLTLGADLGPFLPLPDEDRAPVRWPHPLALAALALAIAAASALTARRIWPPPQIVPQIRIEPAFTDILGHKGGLVEVSVSLRSHVEHEQSVLDLTGSPLA
jgi:beta-lactam-binding protein with PASTA domain